MKVAQIAQAFGMNVLAYTSKTPDQLPEGIRKTTLDGLFGLLCTLEAGECFSAFDL